MGEPYSPDDWRELALRYYDRWEHDRREAARYVSEQSRWMVAQLFVANGGALTALATSNSLRARLAGAGGWFVGGVCLSILCGLVTWAHAQMIAVAFGNMADPAMPTDRDKWPKDVAGSRLMRLAFYGALLLGLTSGLCFLVGALHFT